MKLIAGAGDNPLHRSKAVQKSIQNHAILNGLLDKDDLASLDLVDKNKTLGDPKLEKARKKTEYNIKQAFAPKARRARSNVLLRSFRPSVKTGEWGDSVDQRRSEARYHARLANKRAYTQGRSYRDAPYPEQHEISRQDWHSNQVPSRPYLPVSHYMRRDNLKRQVIDNMKRYRAPNSQRPSYVEPTNRERRREIQKNLDDVVENNGDYDLSEENIDY